MRCPHCAGEIHEDSRFCGICGRRVADAAAPSVPAPAPAFGGAAPGGAGGGAPVGGGFGGQVGSSMSIFELPVSRGARIARVVAILALDAILLAAGVAMIVSYLGNRDDARENAAPAAASEDAEAEVEALPPSPVGAGDAEKGAAGEGRGDATAKARETSTKVRSGGGPARGGGSGADRGGSGGGGSGTDGDPRPPPDSDPDPRVETDPDPGSDPDPEVGSGDGEPGGEGGGPPTEAEVGELARRIGALVGRHRPQLQRCYKTAAKGTTPDRPLQGQVDIQFAVTQDGQAEDVRAVANTTGSDQLAACLRGLVASWSFPQAPGSASIPFVWPFKFRAPQ